MFKRILLAAEDLDHARKAAHLAGDTAREMGASSLCIVVAFPPTPMFAAPPGAEQLTEEREHRANAWADSLLREVGTIPGAVETEVLQGSLAEAALVASQVHQSDLIVMSPKADGLWNRVSAWFRNYRVVGSAGCPVMIVR